MAGGVGRCCHQATPPSPGSCRSHRRKTTPASQRAGRNQGVAQAEERGGGGRVLGCGRLLTGARSAGARARPPSGTATAAVPVQPCTTPVPPHPSRIPPRYPDRESHHRRPPPGSAPAGRPRTSWFHAVAERPGSSCSSHPVTLLLAAPPPGGRSSCSPRCR
jgi:hypothetical protein